MVEQQSTSNPLWDWSADCVQAIENYRREEEEIQMELPSHMNFGVFNVDCLEMKTKLVHGARAHVETLLGAIKEEMEQLVRKLYRELSKLLANLQSKPSSLTDVFAVRVGGRHECPAQCRNNLYQRI